MKTEQMIFTQAGSGGKTLAAILAIALIAACSGGDSPPVAAPSAVSGNVTGKGAVPAVVPRSTGAMAVALSPLPLRVTDDARAVVQYSPGAVKYAWYRNGERLVEAEGETLPQGRCLRGDEVKVLASAGEQRAEAAAVVANSPPKVVKVLLADDRVHRGVDVTVAPEATDPDGDPVSFVYLWSINGEEKSFETAATLSGEKFFKGDRVSVKVVPNDGFEDGAAFVTKDFVVPNAPPSIVSQPPGLSGSSYSYLVKALDPDGDPLTFRLEAGPRGMTIDAATGAIFWPVESDAVGTHEIKVAVTDSDGISDTQGWQLTIVIGTGGKE